MKRLNLFIYTAKIAVSVLFIACFHASAQRNESVSTWNFGSIKAVDANAVNGDITLSSNSGSETTIEIFVSGNSPQIRSRKWSDEEIKQELEKSFTIDVKVEGEKLLVTAKPKTDRSQFSISFKITAPKSINSSIRTINGSISLNNLSGTQNFQTINGSLKVNNVSGEITGRTENGSINAKNANGKITLTTVNGNINIRNINGIISTSTVNGRMRERNVNRE